MRGGPGCWRSRRRPRVPLPGQGAAAQGERHLGTCRQPLTPQSSPLSAEKPRNSGCGSTRGPRAKLPQRGGNHASFGTSWRDNVLFDHFLVTNSPVHAASKQYRRDASSLGLHADRRRAAVPQSPRTGHAVRSTRLSKLRGWIATSLSAPTSTLASGGPEPASMTPGYSSLALSPRLQTTMRPQLTTPSGTP